MLTNNRKLEAVLKFFHSVLDESVASSSFIESMKCETGLELDEAKAVIEEALDRKPERRDDLGEAAELMQGTE